MRQVTLVIFLILGVTQALSAAQKAVLAVLDIEPRNGVSVDAADYMTEKIRVDLFNTGRYQIVERKDMQKLLEEQRMQLAGLTGTDYASKVGKLLSAEKILLGKLTRLDDVFFLNARIVDVATGVMESAATEEADSAGRLGNAATRLVAKLMPEAGATAADPKQPSRLSGKIENSSDGTSVNLLEISIPDMSEVGNYVTSTVDYFLNRLPGARVTVHGAGSSRSSAVAEEVLGSSVSAPAAVGSASSASVVSLAAVSVSSAAAVTNASPDQIDAYVEEVKKNRDEAMTNQKNGTSVPKDKKLKAKTRNKVTIEE